MQPEAEDNERQVEPTNACPAWCIGHDADAPDRADEHIHEAASALVPCIALERTTEAGTNHHHPTATDLTLVRYQYPHDSDTWLYVGDGSHGLDISLESARRLARVLVRYMEEEG